MSENLNTQSRKWMITINNPQTCGLDHNRILELLQLFRPDYFCLADEITGTYHTHILSAKRASGRRLQKPRQEWMEVL